MGSGTVLLLLWALVFRGGSAPQQPADKDQPPSVVTGESLTADLREPEPRKNLVPMEESQHRPDGNAEPQSIPPTGKTLELPDLAELVGPSVVQVNVTGPEEAGTGSGFVLDKQGTIVTNFHVIEDATAGRIVFSDRTSTPITGYLGVWPKKDIALVRVECPPDKLHPLRLATSPPRQGERVVAFGSPLGLQQSVSEGIVSAVRESKEVRALGLIGVNARLIQTTTPISHGNSGGPLVDMKGLVVGVNTWTFRPLGGENVNFAVAAVELPPLLLAKNGTPSSLPASDPAASGLRRILNRGDDYARKGEYDSAIADYTEAIRLDPKNVKAYSGRGMSYYSKGDFDRAIADYTQLIQLVPKLGIPELLPYDYFGRGECYRAKRDYDSAIADFTEAIRLDPKNAEAYYCRGHSYVSKDDYDSAIADFTEAIRIADPTLALRLDPRKSRAYYWRGRAYSFKDDRDSAIADYTQAIRLDPKFAEAYYFRGLCYFRGRSHISQYEIDSIIADFTEAIRLDPKFAEAYYFRGLAYEVKGLRAAAERDFAQAKRLGYKP